MSDKDDKKSIEEIEKDDEIKNEHEIYIEEGKESESESTQDKTEDAKSTNKKKKAGLSPKVWVPVIIILALGIAFLAWGIFNLGWFFGNDTSVKKEEKKEEKKGVACPLNGIETTEELASSRPYALMIENHPDARPQSSLSKADLVFEAVAEGGITRFLAVYGCKDFSDQIGPVRSARPYYVDWSQDFGAFYVHVGGSPDAQKQIKNDDVPDLDQFNYAAYFKRAKNKYAPHNVYTTLEKLRQAAKKSGTDLNFSYEELKVNSEAKKEDTLDAQKIKVPFSGPLYDVEWNYNPAKNNYLRSQAGKPHKDEVSGEQISASSIVVMFTSITPDNSEPDKKRVNIKTKGSGAAWIFQNGTVTRGKWSKDSKSDRTKFFNEEGQLVDFTPGTQWIQVIQAGSKVTYE